jgi:hypothetical protein
MNKREGDLGRHNNVVNVGSWNIDNGPINAASRKGELVTTGAHCKSA